MTMPSRHRDFLLSACSGNLTLTRHPDGCVLIYPRAQWELKRAALVKLPYSARMLQRIVLGSAVDVTLDSAGRILVPADLRSLCRLGKQVALVGLGEHMELWDAGRLAEMEQEALSAGLDSQAADFNF